MNDPAPHISEGLVPCALTIAGSDSGGGAGIQADLRAFSYFGVFGLTAITAVTAQNPHVVESVEILPVEAVADQIQAVFAAFAVGVMKTGMLATAATVRATARAAARYDSVPLVLDPVMVATSGASLLASDAVVILASELMPRATVLTPNLPEAEVLLDRPLRSPRDLPEAARDLGKKCAGLAVVKGGHSAEVAVDWVSDGVSVWRMSSPVAPARTTHGTGCSLSAAVAACLARGDPPLEALRKAKAYVFGTLSACRQAGENTWVMTPPRVLPIESVRVDPVSG